VNRWLVFFAVGWVGMAVQLATVWGLVGGWGLDHLTSTALGVELAILHNFIWHERWTWADRRLPFSGRVFQRLARFNLSSGLLSIGGTVLLTGLLIKVVGSGYLAANVLAIAGCSILNYLAADHLVFGHEVAK
jgi:putative flippase GtrA